MPNTTSKQKWKRRLLWTSGILLLILGILSFTADKIIDRVIRGALDDAEMTFYGITYRLEVEAINTNLLRRSVALQDVQFLPIDTAALDQETDTVQLMIYFEELKLKGLDLRQLINGDSLEIGRIILNDALVEVFVNLDLFDPNDIQFVPNIKALFAENKIGRLNAKSATVRVKIRERNVIHRTFMEPMDLRIDRPTTLATDSTGKAIFRFDHFEMAAEKMLVDLNNGYRFQSGAFSVNSTDSTIQIQDMDFRPRNGTPKVEKGEVRTIDWMFISASTLEASGFEMLDLMHNDGFQSQHILMKDPHISFYQSFYVPDSIEAEKDKLMPDQTIRAMKRRFRIDRLEFNNGSIEYEEVYDTIAEPIYFAVRDMNLILNNFTPRKELLALNDVLEIVLEANILDSVLVNATMHIPILSKRSNFDLSASVGPLDFTMFNPILEAERLKFKSGTMRSMKMECSGDMDRSTGTMDMEYSDLHIQLLKRKKVLPVRLTKHNVMMSFLYNKFIKSNNTISGNNFRQGIINVQRDPSAGFLTYIYENVVASALSSMAGIDDSMANRFPELESSKTKKEIRQEKKQKKRDRKKKK